MAEYELVHREGTYHSRAACAVDMYAIMLKDLFRERRYFWWALSSAVSPAGLPFVVYPKTFDEHYVKKIEREIRPLRSLPSRLPVGQR